MKRIITAGAIRSSVTRRWYPITYHYIDDHRLMTVDYILATGPNGIWVKFV